MKLLKRLLILFAIFLVLFFVSASVYVKFYGKSLIEEALRSSLNRAVVIEKMSYRFPLNLRAQNVRIAHSIEGKQFFRAQDIIAQLSIGAIFQRRLIFNSVKLIKPVIIIEKTETSQGSPPPIRRYGVVIPPEQSDPSDVNSISDISRDQNKNKQTEVLIKHLVLSQGRFEYANSSIDKDFSFAMEDVYLKAENLVFPAQSGQTNFNIVGRLIKEGNPLSGSSVEAHGWVDIVQRNMEARVEVVEADGSVGMTAEAVSKNNDMEVKGEIKFQNILMGVGKGDSSDASAVNNLISSALSSAGVEIGAQFSFKTKMDDFQPEQISFSGKVVTK